MNVSLSALFRVTGPLLTAALSISAPLIAHAQDNGHYVLEKAVQVSRHGVRPQTDTQKLVDATQRQWPTWLVRDGELTGHGYLAASLMGAWQAGHYRQAGLLPAGCPDNTAVYTLSSPKQRTRATAAALLDGMFPGCGQKALASAEKIDPLFQTDKMDFARIDPVIAKGEILKAVGGDLQTLMARLACGEPSSLAWSILKDYSTAFMSCPDYMAANGMRLLAAPVRGDQPIVSGESGAAGAGALHWLMSSPAAADQRETLRLNAEASVLLISTEGDTVPHIYKKIVWQGAYADKECA